MLRLTSMAARAKNRNKDLMQRQQFASNKISSVSAKFNQTS